MMTKQKAEYETLILEMFLIQINICYENIISIMFLILYLTKAINLILTVMNVNIIDIIRSHLIYVNVY